MLRGLLKKKIDAGAIGDAVLVDKSTLDRRLKSVLARPTRHEFNPPKLSPADYLEAGYAVAPRGEAEIPADAGETVTAVAPATPHAGADAPFATDVGPQLEFGDGEGGEAGYGEPTEALHVDDMAAASASESAEPVSADVMVAELDAGMEDAGLPEAAVATDDRDLLPGDPVAEFDFSGGRDARTATDDVDLLPDSVEPARMEAVSHTGEAAGTESVPVGDEDEEEVSPVKAIYVSAEAMRADDPAALTTIVVEEMDYLMFDAGFSPDELPHAAVIAWCASFFVSTAMKDGVGGFAHGAMGEPDLWQSCAEGLEAAGADEHLRVYEDLRALLAWDADTAQHIHDDPKYGESDGNLRALDDALRQAEAEMPLAPLLGAWLKGRPELEVLDEDALEEAVTALATHPVLQARQAARNAESALQAP